MYVYHIRTYQYECRKKCMFILSTARYTFLSGAQLRAPAILSSICCDNIPRSWDSWRLVGSIGSPSAVKISPAEPMHTY